MRKARRSWLTHAAAAVVLTVTVSAQQKREFRYPAAPGMSVSIANEFGPISVRPSNSAQVVIVATPRANKVEIEGARNGNRVDVRTRALQKATPEEARVEYEVQVPTAVNLALRSSDGLITVEGVRGDVTCEGESSHVQVRNGGHGHVHVRTVDGQVTFSNLRNAHLEVQSVGGDVTISDSTGPSFKIHTVKGKINYEGDFAGGGDYVLTTHTGNVTVIMPANASVDVSASSVNGSVEDGFQLQISKHPPVALAQGKSFAGTSNSGAASLKLRSFSGKINLKKK